MRFHSEPVANYPNKNSMLRFDKVHKTRGHDHCILQLETDESRLVPEQPHNK